MSIPSEVAAAIERLSLVNVSLTNDPNTLIGPDGYGYVDRWPPRLNDFAEVSGWIAELSETLVVSPDGSVATIVRLTQAAYDELDPPDPATLYVIVSA
jgi:hypothetical protein